MEPGSDDTSLSATWAQLFDRILDFSEGDRLNLTAFDVSSLDDLQTYTVAQAGPHLVIDFGGGDALQINNITLNTLNDAGFVI